MMTYAFAAELIGYVASVLVAISLTMSSILRLRILNLVGAAVFGLYGVLIGSLPVAIVNVFIVFVNIYYLQKMMKSTEYFKTLETDRADTYLNHFLRFHRDDIQRFIPGFQPASTDVNVFVLRDTIPAGLIMGSIAGSTLKVELDYVIPRFRDFKIGRYLFEECADVFTKKGIEEIVTPAGSPKHQAYLERMGFEPATPETYRLRLKGTSAR
jgi:uncharacterized membrane protein